MLFLTAVYRAWSCGQMSLEQGAVRALAQLGLANIFCSVCMYLYGISKDV